MRFPIRFDAAYRVLSAALLLAPSDSFVEVEGNDVRFRMAWGFRARFPRVSVTEHQKSRPVAACTASLPMAREWLRRASSASTWSPASAGTCWGSPCGSETCSSASRTRPA